MRDARMTIPTCESRGHRDFDFCTGSDILVCTSAGEKYPAVERSPSRGTVRGSQARAAVVGMGLHNTEKR